ncbi:30S ribosomal protein S10 [Rhynchospora pubera]|uniref:30S ribosomal protein S10 n=1 Tax=Rhynchospora pubera TaxID=906938 RepID=A0AAV8FY56_9POAL|nr:30S ribosomal protein S10 [Rhynchospora pubera]
MAIASSLATTLSLVPLRQASFSSPTKPSILCFSLPSPNLSLRLSRAPLPRFYAARPESDEFEPEVVADDESDPELSETLRYYDETLGGFEEDLEGGAEEGDEDGGSLTTEIEEKPKVTVGKPTEKSSSSAKREGKKPTNYQIRIKLKSYWVPLIEDSCKKIIEAARTTNAQTMGPVPLPTKKRVYCVLKSPHKHKNAREHFEIRTHIRLIDIFQPTADTIDSLMQLDFPAGVDVQVRV